jgi:hypothetical protein
MLALLSVILSFLSSARPDRLQPLSNRIMVTAAPAGPWLFGELACRSLLARADRELRRLTLIKARPAAARSSRPGTLPLPDTKRPMIFLLGRPDPPEYSANRLAADTLRPRCAARRSLDRLAAAHSAGLFCRRGTQEARGSSSSLRRPTASSGCIESLPALRPRVIRRARNLRQQQTAAAAIEAEIARLRPLALDALRPMHSNNTQNMPGSQNKSHGAEAFNGASVFLQTASRA